MSGDSDLDSELATLGSASTSKPTRTDRHMRMGCLSQKHTPKHRYRDNLLGVATAVARLHREVAELRRRGFGREAVISKKVYRQKNLLHPAGRRTLAKFR